MSSSRLIFFFQNNLFVGRDLCNSLTGLAQSSHYLCFERFDSGFPWVLDILESRWMWEGKLPLKVFGEKTDVGHWKCRIYIYFSIAQPTHCFLKLWKKHETTHCRCNGALEKCSFIPVFLILIVSWLWPWEGLQFDGSEGARNPVDCSAFSLTQKKEMTSCLAELPS